MNIRYLSFERHYLPGKPVLSLAAACECSDGGEIMRACVTDRIDELHALNEFSVDGVSIDKIAKKLGIAVLDFSAPWRLQPVHIPKPWGQEIWFTGMEARGVSQVVSDAGSTPLPWALALDHQRVLGAHQSLNLLKILDPLPDEVYGDLYFELHEQKREVYIVTQVDERAWPDGTGAIRFGFSPVMREQFTSDADFLSAYRNAVRDYHAVRREMDNQMDALRERDGIDLDEPVSALQTRRWLAELSQALQTQEATLRAQMDAFTAMKPLRVGDVLAVPLRTPHALQHGVRTVEFQTPVYERKILSFAQKVLTQNHWDTDEALQMAQLQTPVDEPFPLLRDSDGVKIEQIVAFDDFSVQRIYLAPGTAYACAVDEHYRLLMVVVGQVDCAGVLVAAEQAVLLPASAGEVLLHNPGAGVLELLLAMPV
jgi:hypothetical protein